MDEDAFPATQLHEPSAFSSGILADNTVQNRLILAVYDDHPTAEEHDPWYESESVTPLSAALPTVTRKACSARPVKPPKPDDCTLTVEWRA